jgi:hypothetical protein
MALNPYPVISCSFVFWNLAFHIDFQFRPEVIGEQSSADASWFEKWLSTNWLIILFAFSWFEQFAKKIASHAFNETVFLLDKEQDQK